MLAKREDLKINKGNTVNFKLQLKNLKNEIFVLEKNAIIYFTVKENFSTDQYIFQKTINNGIKLDEVSNTYIIRIEIDDTESLDYKDYVYDIAFTRNSGLGSANLKEKTTVLIGKFIVCPVATFESNEINDGVVL